MILSLTIEKSKFDLRDLEEIRANAVFNGFSVEDGKKNLVISYHGIRLLTDFAQRVKCRMK